MPQNRVRKLADELSKELERDAPMNTAARRALEELRADVDEALAPDPKPGASGRARSMVEKLEDEHPELTLLVQQLADALSAIGV